MADRINHWLYVSTSLYFAPVFCALPDRGLFQTAVNFNEGKAVILVKISHHQFLDYLI